MLSTRNVAFPGEASHKVGAAGARGGPEPGRLVLTGRGTWTEGDAGVQRHRGPAVAPSGGTWSRHHKSCGFESRSAQPRLQVPSLVGAGEWGRQRMAASLSC